MSIFILDLRNLFYVITVNDVARIAHAIDAADSKSGRVLVLGEREFGTDVPFRSRFGNTLTAFLFRVLYHIRLRDTQTGLRGVPNDVITEFIELKGDRYEYETNMLICSSEKKDLS